MNRRFFTSVALVLVAVFLVAGLSLAQQPDGKQAATVAGGATQQALGTAFSYQGRLADEGAPADGDFDMRFELFDEPDEGGPLANVEIDAVPVRDGYFSTTLDFGPGFFIGEGRWLLIYVRRSGAGEEYTALTPRQPLRPAPYALALPGFYTRPHDTSPNLIGGNAANLVRGGVWGAAISGGGTAWKPNRVTDNYGVIGGGEGNFTGNDDDDFENAEFATVGGGLENEASGWGSVIVGGFENQAGGGVSAVGGGSGNHAAGMGATISGGVDNQALGEYNASVGGGYNNIATETDATVAGGNTNTAGGWAATVSGGISNTVTAGGSVIGGGVFNEILGGSNSTIGGGERQSINHDFATIGGGLNNQVVANFGTVAGGGGWGSETGNIVTGEFGAIGGGRANKADGEYSGVAGGELNEALSAGAVIGGGKANQAGGEEGGVYATVPGGRGNVASGDYSFAAGYQAKALHESAFVWADHQNFQPFESTASGQFLIRASGGVGIGTNDPQAALDVAGHTRTDVLEIDGGLDLAEPFEIAGVESAPPGLAVSIDPAHPGQLRVADQPYDRLVAGCVSGANGIDPGLIMAQEGVIGEEAVPVALTGRAYCFADATFGPIRPGDLLTTSATAGHLMAVQDLGRAQGAVVGKAMSELAQGRGFVLVLVSLQ